MRKLAIAAALVMGGATGAMAQTYNIALKGYCDTFSLTLDGFAIYGTHNDCSTNLVDGGATVKVGKSFLVTNDTVDGAEIFSYYFTPPKNNKGKLYVYEETTSGVTEIAETKYEVTGDAAVARTGKSIIAR